VKGNKVTKLQGDKVVCAVLLILLAACGPALAQSNSLFRQGRAVAPASTSQPASRMPALLLPLAASPIAGRGEQPTPNPALLHTSLIAVAVPQPRKIQVHDPITIIVREDKRATTDSQLKSERDAKLQAELRKWFRLNKDGRLVAQLPEGEPGIDAELDAEYEGKGKVNRKDTLITRIAATVIDVKPNGTLVLQARKDIKVDEDRQLVTLTGICRAEDVAAQNTVLSTQVADLSVQIEHTGPARDAARRGWAARLWDFIRPF